MTDLFETITKADERTVPWPFPSDRKRAERALLEAELNRELAPITRARIDAELGTLTGAASGFSPSNEAPKVDMPACNLNILAIDIGTTTGWALGMRDGALHSGSESFAPRRNDGPGQRWLKFAAWLGERSRQAGEIHAVYYELVLRHTAVQAAHVYGGFEAHLQAWADRNRIRLVGVPVSKIKKFWTGNGGASKDLMVAAATKRGFRVSDDNHADALAILHYAMEEER